MELFAALCYERLLGSKCSISLDLFSFVPIKKEFLLFSASLLGSFTCVSTEQNKQHFLFL